MQMIKEPTPRKLIRAENTITFREREFKGSRLRCLLATSQEATGVGNFLTSLAAPHALITSSDNWAPRGFLKPGEAKLGETPGFLSEADKKVITNWWLVNQRGANTPNWDLVSTCQIGDRRGLLLIEAKSHSGELADDHCGSENDENYRTIEGALTEATAAWNAILPGFALSANSHYQLSNRFAFAWKLAMMRTPVVLVYLGFLDAHEMVEGARKSLVGHAQWQECLLVRSKDTVPQAVWNQTFHVDGTPLTVLIRSARVSIDARLVGIETRL